jgi:cell division protein FtsB
MSLLVAVILAMLTFGDRGFLDVYRLNRRDKALAAEITAARAQIDSLEAEVERLRSDTAYITKIARESLGMARPGEKIYIIKTNPR